MAIDFDYLKNNRIVVYCETEEDTDILRAEAARAKVRISDIRLGGAYFRFTPFRDDYCVMGMGSYGWSSDPLVYTSDGMSIISIQELMCSDIEDMPDLYSTLISV